MSRKINDIRLLILFIIIGTIICYVQGQDVNWDLANYHYYNIWAFFNNKIGYDIMPCGIQSYFNPFSDIPLYFLVNHFNDYPMFIEFFQSIWYGISVFFVYKIATILFTGENRNIYIILSVLIGMSGTISVFEAGLCCNDLMIASFSLIAIYIYLKNYYSVKENESLNQKKIIKTLLISNIIFGFAVGLKYTCFAYYLPFLLLQMIDFIVKKPKIKDLKYNIILFPLLGFILGFSVTGLYWMIFIWHKFGNPFFPLLNNIFKSPFALENNYADIRHVPKNIYQYLFYPFYWFKNPEGGYAYEIPFRDARWIFLYISPFIAFIKFIYLKIRKIKIYNPQINSKILFFILFMTILSYILWLNISGIIRYAIVLELLSGIIIVGTISYCISINKMKNIILLILCIFLLCSTQYIKSRVSDVRCAFQSKFIDIKDLNLPDNAVVFICGGYPTSIVIPFQNPKAKFIYIYGDSTNYNFEYPETEILKIKKLIKDKKYKKFLIYSEYIYQPIDWNYIEKFLNKNNFECKETNTGWLYGTYILCGEK